MMKNYFKPTPKKYRMLGDLMLVLIPFVITGIKEAPNLSDVEKYWLGFFAGCILIIGKFATNFFTDETDK